MERIYDGSALARAAKFASLDPFSSSSPLLLFGPGL